MYQEPMPQNFNYQEPIRSDEVYANIIQEDRIRNVVSQTSPDNQLKEIAWRLKGYIRNGESWEKIDDDTEELNPLIVSRYVSFLSSIMQDSGRLTNLSETQINNMMSNIIDYLTDDLDGNSELYGLEEDYTERTRIALIILYNTFFVLNRSLNGTEAKRIWGIMNLTEVNSVNPQQNRTLFDRFKSMFR